jgi:ABC-2 type transport system ATP-binding protein
MRLGSQLPLSVAGPAVGAQIEAVGRLDPDGWPSAPAAQIAIRIDKLYRTFGAITAVDRLTLEIPQGVVFGFLGPNGAGKTTTIRLLLGLLEATSGRVDVLGFDPRYQGDEIRQRSGALLEQPGIYDRLSAEANLNFYAHVWRLSSRERIARVKELLVKFGLWDRRKESRELWSTGMRQKLAVARALLHRPALLFLDEPTSGLDPLAAHELGDDLVRLAASEGVSIVLTTHDLGEAERLCEHVAVMRNGRLLATGTPAELRALVGGRALVVGRGFDDSILRLLRLQPEVASVELDGDRLEISLRKDCSLAPLVTLLARAGADIEEVRRSTVTLEEAFVQLVSGAI